MLSPCAWPSAHHARLQYSHSFRCAMPSSRRQTTRPSTRYTTVTDHDLTPCHRALLLVVLVLPLETRVRVEPCGSRGRAERALTLIFALRRNSRRRVQNHHQNPSPKHHVSASAPRRWALQQNHNRATVRSASIWFHDPPGPYPTPINLHVERVLLVLHIHKLSLFKQTPAHHRF
ncbi:hypothetical protein P152DRAFT_342147 [Eremomyces bilateralis CBS 781.70]|uniref:Uncharacterized protein n=1 Tax=Eremomyces bilateralis CBS 781.70 TaxID=1392243 RepID=A0A6G1G3D9_9PEZI|nr:uncharacterized protein P152DRAFT_342147 [Eremomyces bilateralis CBS 781.70]KAF1812528.1 hypothetical protein P152DRAFT_342147 [Eremomyces bilateralis CBS 781.70]